MRSTSGRTDGLSRLSSSTRIFVALTGAEAAALGRLSRDGDLEAIRALAKIRTALEHAIADATSPPQPSASAVPPLRAKAYRPRTDALRMAKATLPAKLPKKTLMAPVAAAERDDYVPFRDEADGIYT